MPAHNPLPKEAVAQVEGIFRKMLPDFIKEDEVRRIAEQVFEKSRDKNKYANLRHRHALEEVDAIETLTKGLAKLGHRHDSSEVDGLDGRIAAAVATVQVPTDYAKEGHRHGFDDIDGTLPVSRLVGGDKLLLGLHAIDGLKNHQHPELKQEIEHVHARIDALPVPRPYDDTKLLRLIDGLQKQIAALEAREQRVVEVSVQPVQAASVTCEAEYLITGSDPGQPKVVDANGREGQTRVTARDGKYLVRGVFAGAPKQPLTFTFVPAISPPILCSIGSSPDSVMN